MNTYYIDLGSLEMTVDAELSEENKMIEAKKVLQKAIEGGDIEIVNLEQES